MTMRGRYEVTANDAYRLLRTVLNTCVADEVISRNPCQVNGSGHVRSPERPIAEVSEVSASLKGVSVRYRLVISLAIYCHLRRGEIVGLQRSDIDVERAELSRRRTRTVPMGKGPGPRATEDRSGATAPSPSPTTSCQSSCLTMTCW